MRINEIFFLLAAAGMIAALPLLLGGSLLIWFLAKIAYFAGVFFYIIKK